MDTYWIKQTVSLRESNQKKFLDIMCFWLMNFILKAVVLEHEIYSLTKSVMKDKAVSNEIKCLNMMPKYDIIYIHGSKTHNCMYKSINQYKSTCLGNTCSVQIRQPYIEIMKSLNLILTTYCGRFSSIFAPLCIRPFTMF